MSTATGYGPMRAPTGRNDRIPRGYEKGTLSQFTPEQMQLFQRMFSQVDPESFLGKLAGGDEGMFAQLEAPALKQFSGMQGNLASRFSDPGTGARHSSGFQNFMNQASSDFAQSLQSKRMGLQQNALMQLMQLSQMLLGERPYEQFLLKKEHKPSFGQQIFGAALPVGGAALGGTFGGLGGAKLGATIGSNLGSGFMR